MIRLACRGGQVMKKGDSLAKEAQRVMNLPPHHHAAAKIWSGKVRKKRASPQRVSNHRPRSRQANYAVEEGAGGSPARKTLYILLLWGEEESSRVTRMVPQFKPGRKRRPTAEESLEMIINELVFCEAMRTRRAAARAERKNRKQKRVSNAQEVLA